MRQMVRRAVWTSGRAVQRGMETATVARLASGGYDEARLICKTIASTSRGLSDKADHDTSCKSGTLTGLVNHFDGTSTSIGYGSGVFEQAGYGSGSRPQIDLVHVVDSTSAFHRQNLNKYPHHYSALKYLGVRAIDWVQSWGPGLYFMPFVHMDGHVIKYGIVSESTAIQDIVEWRNMFLAGRLQKPVRFIGGDGTLAKLNEYNLHSAMVVAVLLLNTSNFTKTALYETITSLSYLGDPRMSVGGENPNKVRNIVSKQYDRFDRIYGPVLNGLKSRQLLQIDEPAGQIRVTIGSHSRHELLLQLPKHFRSVLQSNSGQTLAQLAQSPQLQHQMAQALRKTVSYPAVVQSAKGLITAGIYKSISYLIQKRIKYLRG
ncbi:Mitochondrial translocator assembly and maintenance protein 41 [Yamadazyma tenuis]|uniref:Phosphatidate cytidylyltransferase, mitochondrial n=2 Tax=Candida tenuis (strain ATCC 10573 / BCRC 21748 / CBS 615 / JCM 9827 / NBRC 10315 / NRRL Y-1498 / VKM Y-70) TaxID=590646 RepID=G3B682_CANTC|nr:uncharacterized protein CANTEDRAFT_123619 [Yamadazyma tenuis ATCC 10573]EGV63407.1 hypothetical protein CANTEDRAFT_123619 [Yamadazyma tenuis ATCC 10573]WEJ96770.1 Mitochondrial translocator assembly and maintenance protein 41 [Yamadazyma tenuis]